MKIYVTMKCPDALEDSIARACEDEIGGGPHDEAKDIEYQELVYESTNIAKKWFEYGELVTLVIDTDNETCTVEEC